MCKLVFSDLLTDNLFIYCLSVVYYDIQYQFIFNYISRYSRTSYRKCVTWARLRSYICMLKLASQLCMRIWPTNVRHYSVWVHNVRRRYILFVESGWRCGTPNHAVIIYGYGIPQAFCQIINDLYLYMLSPQ